MSSVSSSRFICSKCGKECKDKRGLTLHRNRCNIDRQFICEFCNQEFATSYSLSMHITRCKTMKIQKENIAKEEMTTINNELMLQKEKKRIQSYSLN